MLSLTLTIFQRLRKALHCTDTTWTHLLQTMGDCLSATFFSSCIAPCWHSCLRFTRFFVPTCTEVTLVTGIETIAIRFILKLMFRLSPTIPVGSGGGASVMMQLQRFFYAFFGWCRYLSFQYSHLCLCSRSQQVHSMCRSIIFSHCRCKGQQQSSL